MTSINTLNFLDMGTVVGRAQVREELLALSTPPEVADWFLERFEERDKQLERILVQWFNRERILQ